MIKKILSVMCTLVILTSICAPVFAAKGDSANKADNKTAIAAEKANPNKEPDYREAIAAAEAAALEEAGIARQDAKYVDSHVEYDRGVAYAVHVEIGVYEEGVGTVRSSYLVDIETSEILNPVEG